MGNVRPDYAIRRRCGRDRGWLVEWTGEGIAGSDGASDLGAHAGGCMGWDMYGYTRLD